MNAVYIANVLNGVFCLLVVIAYSIIKNTLLLPLEIIGLIAVFNVILPLLNRRDWISPRTEPPIRWK